MGQILHGYAVNEIEHILTKTNRVPLVKMHKLLIYR
jgi:hypothetical protein